MKKIAFIVLLLLVIALAGCQKGQKTDPAALAKFKEFVQKEDFSYTATYDVISQDNEFRMTQYFKDENNVRTDLEIDIDGGEIRSYILNKQVYTCSMQQEEWVCIKLEGQEIEDFQETFEKIETHPEEYQIAYDGTKEVSGMTGYCFTIKMPEMMGIAIEECFSGDAVPIYMSVGSLLQMTVISYGLEVDDADFVLPTEAMTIDELMEDQENEIDLSGLDEKSLSEFDPDKFDIE